MDPLTDVLALAGVRSTIGAHICAGADWGTWRPDAGGSSAFHAVITGTAWIMVDGEAEPLELTPGDVVLLPHGTPHAIAGDRVAVRRTSALHSDPHEQTGAGVIRIGSGTARTHILCAHYEHDPGFSTPVLELLPNVVVVRAAAGAPGLDRTIALIGDELQHGRLAADVVLRRLVDVLLVQIIRAWIERQPEDAVPSWLAGLRDPVVRAAVGAMHEAPAQPWTTETLAATVAVSRATLARRFAAAVGESPSAYLTRWRMDLAARHLRDTDDAIDTVARTVGYTSVPAFTRAFSRARSMPPGRFRAEARA